MIVRVSLTCIQDFVVSQEEFESQGQQALVERAFQSIFGELKSVSERGLKALMMNVNDQAGAAVKAIKKGTLALKFV